MAELQTIIIIIITAVAVYPSRARVTRSGTVTLEPGSHRLEMPELSLKLDPASVRASARGTARARLLGVDVRRDFYVETPAGRVRELAEQVESLEDEVRGLDAQTELIKRERIILDELESAEPQPTEKTELNLLDWALTLAPGEKRVVRFDFTVEHPRGMSLE